MIRVEVEVSIPEGEGGVSRAAAEVAAALTNFPGVVHRVNVEEVDA